MKLEKGKDILLFYEKHQWDYFDDPTKRTISGFYAWYQLLVKALRGQGYVVHENDFELASQHPKFPIGLVGTPKNIPKWNLPNPAILGPSLYDNPRINPSLMEDERFKYYLVTSEWFKILFDEIYGEDCVKVWYAGIPLDEWKDVSQDEKTIDVLIYNKIRWAHDAFDSYFIKKITDELDRKNLSYQFIQYGSIPHQTYKEQLSRSKAMIFLCEHETQGIAYQEALASNVPILAWNPGWWVDPQWTMYYTEPVPASSVPYFSKDCGEEFKTIEQFPNKLDIFWEQLHMYKPRKYVEAFLSLEGSSKVYLDLYNSLI